MFMQCVLRGGALRVVFFSYQHLKWIQRFNDLATVTKCKASHVLSDFLLRPAFDCVLREGVCTMYMYIKPITSHCFLHKHFSPTPISILLWGVGDLEFGKIFRKPRNIKCCSTKEKLCIISVILYHHSHATSFSESTLTRELLLGLHHGDDEDKPACLIIRLLFGFARNVRRQCCLWWWC